MLSETRYRGKEVVTERLRNSVSCWLFADSARSDAEIPETLPEGIDRTEEAYKREIIRLRIENKRLKKLCGTNERGSQRLDKRGTHRRLSNRQMSYP